MLELGELAKKAEQHTVIVIFGFSHLGLEIYGELRNQVFGKEIYYCDNDERKQDGKKVLSVYQAIAGYPGALFITASRFHGQEMERQLLEGGVDSSCIEGYLPYSSRISGALEEMIRRITPMPELQFEVDLARHCNLNCRYCDHFSPLAQEEFPEYAQFEKDINRLSFLFQKRARRIFLLGGEPLLNPQIRSYLVCARHAFPGAPVSVVTNGLLLGKMEPEFWETCRREQIEILITRYPVGNSIYEKAEKACRTEGVKWRYFNDTSVWKSSYHYPLDLEGRQDARAMYLHCANANECITLKKGKLYPCSVAPNIEHFNRFFHQGLELCENDGIDIYQTDNRNEILRFLSQPIPFCRYCRVNERTYGHAWGISRKEIGEWT